MLSGKAERFTRFRKRKLNDKKTKEKKVSVVLDNPKWISWSVFPYPMLQKRYQALLLKHLKEEILKNINSETPDPDLKVFADPGVSKTFFDDLQSEYQHGFFVNCSEERHDLKPTVGYIGRYARRPPLSEIRIKNYTGEFVTFEFKDYRNNGSKVLHTLKTVEFIRKLVRHIPPHYFNVIRHYGLLASRAKTKYKAITDKLLVVPAAVKAAKKWRERQTDLRENDPLLCRICRRVMVFVSAILPKSLYFSTGGVQSRFFLTIP